MERVDYNDTISTCCLGARARSSYRIIQSSFISFSPTIFRLTGLDINSK